MAMKQEVGNIIRIFDVSPSTSILEVMDRASLNPQPPPGLNYHHFTVFDIFHVDFGVIGMTECPKSDIVQRKAYGSYPLMSNSETSGWGWPTSGLSGLIIREMLRRIRHDAGLSEPPKVADYFGVICGPGFGGFVCAVPELNLALPRIFRTYPVRSNANPDRFVWQAARATLSIPDLFEPISIGSLHISERFVSGELGWNNPTHELTVEVANLFGECDVAWVVSIGSGHTIPPSLRGAPSDIFRQITEDCQRRHNEMAHRFERVERVYWRFSVIHGMEDGRDMDALLLILCDPPPAIPNAHHLQYTGRAAVLTAMRSYFLNRKYQVHISVLYGIGGGGKTQSALMFVQQSMHDNLFTDVFFFDASDNLALENGFKALAIAHGAGDSFEAGFHYLRGRRHAWLLLLDNADNPDFDLGPFLRWSHGNMCIITTHNHKVRSHAPDCNIRVDRLDLQEAKKLLIRGVEVPTTVNVDKVSGEIVEELSSLALAINQARTFLAIRTCTLVQYLALYRKNRKKLLQDQPSQSTDDYENTVYTTWMISILSSIFLLAWERFSELESDKQGKTVPELLCVFFSGLFRNGSDWDETAFLGLLDDVLSLSLCDFDSSNQLLSFHPLVQISGDSVQQQDSGLRQKENARIALSRVWEAGRTLREGGLVERAQAVFELGFKETQQDLGSDHPDTLQTMYNLAVTCSVLGHHQDALRLKEEVLKVRKLILVPNHPDTLWSMHNLAITYAKLGRHGDSLRLNEEALELRKCILDHADTLNTMDNLVVTYSNLDKHSDALKLNEEVLEVKKRTLGLDHLDTILAMHNLSVTYSCLGRHHDALKFNEKVLELRKRILGPDHPDTLKAWHNPVISMSAFALEPGGP
ncbi:hypothetical protein DL96DRAFT_1810826 [Flagelloscypha sp. PMI_526]|nr:hypothetical protein DL96DRAFT_1810826 [Flagelloscypha sp. PMI_526]